MDRTSRGHDDARDEVRTPHPDAAVFPPRRTEDFDRVLAAAIRHFLGGRGRLTDRQLIVAAMQRRFRGHQPMLVANRTRLVLDRRAAFRCVDGQYGLVGWGPPRPYRLPFAEPPAEEVACLPDVRSWAEVPGLAPAHRTDLCTSWVHQLGSTAARCRLVLTLEPADPEAYENVELEIFLHASREPVWVMFTRASVGAPITTTLSGRGWVTWMPHHHPGSRERRHLAPRRFAAEPLNDVVMGVIARSAPAVEFELAALLSRTAVPLDRVDARWEAPDEDELHEMEHSRRVLVEAFEWVRARTGGVSAPPAWHRGPLPETGLHGTCLVCGRDLRVEKSVDEQIGPECRKRALERMATAGESLGPWGGPEQLLERIARTRHRVPLQFWAYARLFPPA